MNDRNRKCEPQRQLKIEISKLKFDFELRNPKCSQPLKSQSHLFPWDSQLFKSNPKPIPFPRTFSPIPSHSHGTHGSHGNTHSHFQLWSDTCTFFFLYLFLTLDVNTFSLTYRTVLHTKYGKRCTKWRNWLVSKSEKLKMAISQPIFVIL